MIRALALGTLLALPAAAHPLDRFVAASEGAEVVVLIPRLAHITEPLAATLRRMRQVPALKGALGSEEAVPWGLLDPDFQRKNGIDPQGSFAYAKVAAGPVLRLPVTGPEVVEGLLTTLGRTLTPRADGWQTEEGVALYREGGILGAANDAILQPFLPGAPDKAPPDKAPLAHCPRGPGEADLYVWAKAGTGRGCVTVQVDAHRLRIEALAEGLPERWFGDGDSALLARVGAESNAVLGLHLAPATLVNVARDARLHPIALALDGRVALGAGPTPGTATLAFGVADEAAARAALTTHAAAMGLVPDGQDTWRLPKPLQINEMLTLEALHLGLRSRALIVTTHRPQLEAAPALPSLVAGIERPVVVVANRTGGRPHDGRGVVDALTPVVGSGIDGMRPWIHAAAWIGGQLGAWHVAVTRAGSKARLVAEVELL